MSRVNIIYKLQSKRFVLWAVLVALVAGGSASAASGRDEPTVAEMLKNAMKAMDAKQYEIAVDNMYLYLSAVDKMTSPRAIALSQDIRLKLATVLVNLEGRKEEAIVVLREYVNRPYGKERRRVMSLLITLQYEMGTPEENVVDKKMFQGAIDTIYQALEYDKNPQNESPLVKTGDDSAKDKLTDYQKIIAAGDVEDPYPSAEILRFNMLLGECYYGLKKWDKCIEPYTYTIENNPDEQRKGYAIMQIINALVELEDFERIQDWIPQLYRTSARYDIRVNLALMNVAKALYDRGMYDSALPLYRMILPRDELVAYQESVLREMRIAEGLTPEENMAVSDAEKMLFGAPEESPVADEGTKEKKSKEITNLEQLIAALKKLPAYENNMTYQMGNIYHEVKRLWEAVTFYDAVYEKTSESELGEHAVYELIDVLMNEINNVEEAEKRSYEYLDSNKKGLTPRMIAYLLTTHYQETKKLKELKVLLPYIDGFDRSNLEEYKATDQDMIVKYDIELYFMQAVADLMLYNFDKAELSLKRLLDEYPHSHLAGNTFYWYGMSLMFQQKYESAMDVFEQYTTKFAGESWVDEAYYQGGVCLFGLDKYEEALDRFSYVIKTFPKSSIFPEACNMRGDIYGSKGGDFLDAAVDDYKLALKFAEKTSQATYSTFQMAKVFEAEDRYEEIIEVVTPYLNHGWKGADIAKAMFWIGKTKIQQGLVDEAVLIYVDNIIEYGGDLLQEGVDSMITELAKISTGWLDANKQVRLKARLSAAESASDNLTLKLRLRVLLAKLNRSEVELGKQLLTELTDFEHASPPVLAAICNASFELKDYSRAEEILRMFTTQFDESDYIRAAYKLRASGQYAENDYEGALQTIAETQGKFGVDYDVAWAQLMKAQVLLDDGRYDEARAANMMVFDVPDWRGSPVAQANYQLGQVDEALGEWLAAFGCYQRTYFLYKGHAGGYWAAEAYLASARCLKNEGLMNDYRNTYRAMLYDRYVNTLPQADVARQALGETEVAEIEAFIATGSTTNIAVEVEVPTKSTTNVEAMEVE